MKYGLSTRGCADLELRAIDDWTKNRSLSVRRVLVWSGQLRCYTERAVFAQTNLVLFGVVYYDPSGPDCRKLPITVIDVERGVSRVPGLRIAQRVTRTKPYPGSHLCFRD